MLIIPPALSRPRRRHAKRAVTKAPPAALVLVAAAVFTDDGIYVHMRFGRAIDISAMDVSQVSAFVGGDWGFAMIGTGLPVVIDPQTVRVDFIQVDDYFGDDMLSATAATGIVAVNDGGTWPGVTDLVLPFG